LATPPKAQRNRKLLKRAKVALRGKPVPFAEQNIIEEIGAIYH
jgi:hypothetical protein